MVNRKRVMLVEFGDGREGERRSTLEARPEIDVCAVAKGVDEAVQHALDEKPEVIAIHLESGDEQWIKGIRRLRVLCPESLLLVITNLEDRRNIVKMLAEGVAGWLERDASPDEFVEAVEALSNGNVYLRPALVHELFREHLKMLEDGKAVLPANSEAGKTEETGLEKLSQRECQVLEMISQGLSNQEIGGVLGLSPKTIARHRERIMKKLNLHSRTALVKFAIRNRLVELG